MKKRHLFDARAFHNSICKDGKFCVARDTWELFYISFHTDDDVPVELTLQKCVVHFIPQHKQIPAQKQHPRFIDSENLWHRQAH
jgi:hypothetical protein